MKTIFRVLKFLSIPLGIAHRAVSWSSCGMNHPSKYSNPPILYPTFLYEEGNHHIDEELKRIHESISDVDAQLFSDNSLKSCRTCSS